MQRVEPLKPIHFQFMWEQKKGALARTPNPNRETLVFAAVSEKFIAIGPHVKKP